jgi:hypothetical protein
MVFANSLCALTSDSSELKTVDRHWSFGEQHLICDQKFQHSTYQKLKAYPYDDLLVIRGHVSKINPTVFKQLHHSAGFNLVQVLGQMANQNDDHLAFIPLNQFQPIHNFKAASKMVSPDVQHLVNQVDANRWLGDIITLSAWSRRTGQAGNVSAANWIATQFNAMNLEVRQPNFQVGSSNTKNIMGIQVGQTRPDDWYLVGGHMDSVPSGNAPGAVDNASGCAAVIEMARIASQFSFQGTLIFICFSGEEQGLYGSEFHADTLISENNDDKIKVALTLDMVGYTSNSDHELLLESSGTYQSLMNEMAQNAATYVPDLSVQTTTNYFGSDHVSYINNGMPGILSIDVDYGIYPDYHQSSDLPENINTTQGEYIIKTNLATIADKAAVLGLADLIFRSGFE